MTPIALALLAAVPPQDQVAPARPATSTAPELADPLADPAAQPPQTLPAPPVGAVSKQPAAARALETAPPGALVRAHPRHAKGDPLEGMNRKFFRLNTSLDHAIFRPAAMGYKHVVPKPIRSGLRNFFSNIMEPIVFLNYLLQLKPGKAAETLGRFTVNSTLGLGGAVDVAKRRPFHLPHRDNSFGDTLGRYGVGPGPYLFLPFAGPTTLRDLVGGQVDRLVLPFTIQRPPFDSYEYQVPKAVITGLDARAQADDELKALYSGAVDPYATLRSVFLQSRRGEIEALRHPHAVARAQAEELDQPLSDPAAAPSTAAPAAPELNDPLTDPAAKPAATPAQPAPAQSAPTQPAPTKAAPVPAELADPLTDPAATPTASGVQPPAVDPAAPARK